MERTVSLAPILTLFPLVGSGQLTVDWNGATWMRLDADGRNLEIDLRPVGHDPVGIERLLRASLLRNLGVPRRLAKLGWRVAIALQGRTVLWAGRGASPLTDYVHVEWKALPRAVRAI